jgi:hypothetical protein
MRRRLLIVPRAVLGAAFAAVTPAVVAAGCGQPLGVAAGCFQQYDCDQFAVADIGFGDRFAVADTGFRMDVEAGEAATEAGDSPSDAPRDGEGG